jgi:hypothetical protein
MLIETLGNSLQRIKDEDGATDADIGRILGKSKDSAERHRKGIGDMGAVSFLLGCAAWDGRFANDALAKVGMKLVPLATSGAANDRSWSSDLTKLLLKMSLALEDGNLDDDELDSMAAEIEGAGRAIDQMRQRRARSRGAA